MKSKIKRANMLILEINRKSSLNFFENKIHFGVSSFCEGNFKNLYFYDAVLEEEFCFKTVKDCDVKIPSHKLYKNTVIVGYNSYTLNQFILDLVEFIKHGKQIKYRYLSMSHEVVNYAVELGIMKSEVE